MSSAPSFWMRPTTVPSPASSRCPELSCLCSQPVPAPAHGAASAVLAFSSSLPHSPVRAVFLLHTWDISPHHVAELDRKWCPQGWMLPLALSTPRHPLSSGEAPAQPRTLHLASSFLTEGGVFTETRFRREVFGNLIFSRSREFSALLLRVSAPCVVPTGPRNSRGKTFANPALGLGLLQQSLHQQTSRRACPWYFPSWEAGLLKRVPCCQVLVAHAF